MCLDKIQCVVEMFHDLRSFLPFEKLRAGNHQSFHHANAVRTCPAACLRDLLFGFGAVAALRRDQMNVSAAPAGVHVGITGVFFFRALVVSFDVPNLRAFIFGEL